MNLPNTGIDEIDAVLEAWSAEDRERERRTPTRFFEGNADEYDCLGLWLRSFGGAKDRPHPSCWFHGQNEKLMKGWKKDKRGDWHLKLDKTTWVHLTAWGAKFFATTGNEQHTFLYTCVIPEGPAVVLFPHYEPARIIAANMAWNLWKPGKYQAMLGGGLWWEVF